MSHLGRDQEATARSIRILVPVLAVLVAVRAFAAGPAANGNTFADARGAFSGHEICDSNRWLHSVDFGDFGESYHPTADGHSQAYLPTFSAAA